MQVSGELQADYVLVANSAAVPNNSLSAESEFIRSERHQLVHDSVG